MTRKTALKFLGALFLAPVTFLRSAQPKTGHVDLNKLRLMKLGMKSIMPEGLKDPEGFRFPTLNEEVKVKVLMDIASELHGWSKS